MEISLVSRDPPPYDRSMLFGPLPDNPVDELAERHAVRRQNGPRKEVGILPVRAVGLALESAAHSQR